MYPAEKLRTEGLDTVPWDTVPWNQVRREFFSLYLGMLRVQKTLCRQLDRISLPASLSLAPSHVNALLIVSRHGTINMSQLAREMLISRQQMTGVADLLEEKELVCRRGSPCNRRITLLELTPLGDLIVRQLDEWLLQALPEDGLMVQRLAQAMETIRELMAVPPQ